MVYMKLLTKVNIFNFKAKHDFNKKVLQCVTRILQCQSSQIMYKVKLILPEEAFGTQKYGG